MNQFVRCFKVGDRIEFSYDSEEDLRRLYAAELPWADINATTGEPGISVFRLWDGALVIWTGVRES